MKRSPENTGSKSTPTNFNSGNANWTNTSQTSRPPEQAQEQQQNADPATTIVPAQQRASFDDCIQDVHVLTDLIQFADPVNNPQLALVNTSFLHAWQQAARRQRHSPLNEEIQHFIDNQENICKYYEQFFSCKYYIELLKPLKNDYSLEALKLKETHLDTLNYMMSFTLKIDPARYIFSSNAHLTWSGGYLTRLPIDESFMEVPCESWDLSDNNLSEIPPFIWKSKSLLHLDITGNLFKDLPTNSPDILCSQTTINTDGTIKTTKITKEKCLSMQKNATVNENTSNNDQTSLSSRNRQPKQ